MTCSCATWQETVSAENWDDVNVKLDEQYHTMNSSIIQWIAVLYNEYVGDKNLLPCPEQETEQLYQKITDINQKAGKEQDEGAGRGQGREVVKGIGEKDNDVDNKQTKWSRGDRSSLWTDAKICWGITVLQPYSYFHSSVWCFRVHNKKLLDNRKLSMQYVLGRGEDCLINEVQRVNFFFSPTFVIPVCLY